MIIENEVIIEDLVNYSDLSFYDSKSECIDLFHKGEFYCYAKVWLDSEMDNREYICINDTIMYLDTMNNIAP